MLLATFIDKLGNVVRIGSGNHHDGLTDLDDGGADALGADGWSVGGGRERCVALWVVFRSCGRGAWRSFASAVFRADVAATLFAILAVALVAVASAFDELDFNPHCIPRFRVVRGRLWQEWR